MFWGCVTHSGSRAPIPISGNVNFEKYFETRDQKLGPVIAKYFVNSLFISQDKNTQSKAYQLKTVWEKPENNIDCLD